MYGWQQCRIKQKRNQINSTSYVFLFVQYAQYNNVFFSSAIHSNEDGSEGSTVTKAVLITMSVAGAYIVLVIGLMIWCRYRRRTRKLPVSEGKIKKILCVHTLQGHSFICYLFDSVVFVL